MKEYSRFVNDLKTLISYKSTEGAAVPGAPFGEEVKNALGYFLSLAKDFGFETVNYDNYAGEIVFGAKGLPEIGVIGHLDVVPAGGNWDSDPFTLTFKDGVYYGRGVQDDKGPMLQCLYAMKELKDSGVNPAVRFRLFVGCNEETGWQDVKYLAEHTEIPEYGFSPDGDFPVSYAEKGVEVFEFEFPALKNFYDLKGGTAVNAVCAYASVKARPEGINEELLKKHGLKINGDFIESFGVAAHGSAPHLGKNAFLPLFSYMAETGEPLTGVIDCLFRDKYGIGNLVNEQGKVTFSPDLIKERDGKTYIVCDCRVPAPFALSNVEKVVDKFGIKYEVSEKHPPLLVEKNGKFVETLLNAYKKVTGENAEPQSMGGSTFARVFKKGCAFGCEFEGVDAHIHDANERISEELLLKSYEIYKTAFFDLAKGV